jgi:hypothetical protein
VPFLPLLSRLSPALAHQVALPTLHPLMVLSCRAQKQAAQAAAVEAQRSAALARIMPTPGPTLRVAQLFTPRQAGGT